MLKSRLYARLTYRKTGLLRFLGHLDVARAFDRAVRRAKLPVEYSQGFSPHALISFASPLPVGVAGEAELCAVDLASAWEATAVLKSLARQLPLDLMVGSAQVLARGRRSPFADLAAADYQVNYRGITEADLQAALRGLDGRSQWPVHRVTKSRELDLDLRPRIGDLRIEPGPTLRMRLGLAEDNLAKPEEVLGLLAAELGPAAETSGLTRTAVWLRGEAGRKFVD
jgi:radical SAM-linked protein